MREAAQAKLFGSETFASVTNQGMQIMDGYSDIMEYDMPCHYRRWHLKCSVTLSPIS